jgi:hypothetical protein
MVLKQRHDGYETANRKHIVSVKAQLTETWACHQHECVRAYLLLTRWSHEGFVSARYVYQLSHGIIRAVQKTVQHTEPNMMA